MRKMEFGNSLFSAPDEMKTTVDEFYEVLFLEENEWRPFFDDLQLVVLLDGEVDLRGGFFRGGNSRYSECLRWGQSLAMTMTFVKN